MSFTRIRYEGPQAGVARIVLARPDTRNAQDKHLLYELNDAFDRAAHDNDVRVVVLAADGPHFSSGHDLRDTSKMREFTPVSCWGGYDLPGAEGFMAIEEEIYLGLCWRWRNFPKPTIAEVQGKVIAGGLMLVWVCDLIVAADDAEFSDPVVAFGAERPRVLRAPLGGRRPPGQADALHRGRHLRPPGLRTRHGERGRPRRRVSSAPPATSPSGSPAARPWASSWPSRP